MRTMRMEREDIENSLKVLSHIVDDDFIITVDEARKIIEIDGETIEALQAEVKDLKKVNMELFEDLPKYVKDELPKEKGWYYLVYLSKWNGKEWWVPPFPDYWTKPPQEEL